MVDGVGGAEAIALEEGVKVEGLAEPFGGEVDGDATGGAGDGVGEGSSTEGRRVDKKEESVSGGAVISMAVEVDGEAPILDDGRGDGDHRHRTFADDDARIVDLAVEGETVFVYSFEEGIGAVLLAHSLPVESHEVRLLHVGGELGYLCEVAAVRLLRLGAGIGHMGRHRALALPSMPGVIYFVAELAALNVTVFSCHNCYLGCTYITEKHGLYCVEYRMYPDDTLEVHLRYPGITIDMV